MKQTPADRGHEARMWARAAAEKPEQPLRLSCSSCLFSDKDLGDGRQRDGRQRRETERHQSCLNPDHQSSEPGFQVLLQTGNLSTGLDMASSVGPSAWPVLTCVFRRTFY